MGTATPRAAGAALLSPRAHRAPNHTPFLYFNHTQPPPRTTASSPVGRTDVRTLTGGLPPLRLSPSAQHYPHPHFAIKHRNNEASYCDIDTLAGRSLLLR